LQQDEKEEYETQRQLLEYQISFIPDANEAVRKLWDRRNEDNTIKTEENEFEGMLNETFRRDEDPIRFIPLEKK